MGGGPGDLRPWIIYACMCICIHVYIYIYIYVYMYRFTKANARAAGNRLTVHAYEHRCVRSGQPLVCRREQQSMRTHHFDFTLSDAPGQSDSSAISSALHCCNASFVQPHLALRSKQPAAIAAWAVVSKLFSVSCTKCTFLPPWQSKILQTL